MRAYSGSTKLDEFTSQSFMDESITDAVHSQAPYAAHGTRDTRNNTDMIFASTAHNSRLLLNLTKTDVGYAGVVDVGVSLKTPAVSKGIITPHGVVNAASYSEGIAQTPGSRSLAKTSRPSLSPSQQRTWLVATFPQAWGE